MSNILDKARKIVYERSEEIARQYGPFQEGMERAARIYSGMTGEQFTATQMYKAMIALKLSRESYNHKEDNLLDAVAYMSSMNDYVNQQQAFEDLLKTAVDLAETAKEPENDLSPIEEKSRRWWLKRSLSQEDYEKAIKNTKNVDRLSMIKENAADSLSGAFSWGDTPEGSDYWRKIYTQLEKKDEPENDLSPIKEKTAQWWFKRSLSQKDYESAVSFIRKDEINNEYRKASDALISAFGWSRTKEGGDYWNDIHEQLLKENK